jgi:hypothetical protein
VSPHTVTPATPSLSATSMYMRAGGPGFGVYMTMMIPVRRIFCCSAPGGCYQMRDLYGACYYGSTHWREWRPDCMLSPGVAGLQRTLRGHHRWLLRLLLVPLETHPVVLGRSVPPYWGQCSQL